MLLACILVVIAVLVFVLRDPNSAWNMVFSWWRASTSINSTTPIVQESSREEPTIKPDEADETVEDEAATPKARTLANGLPIPSFSLDKSADFSSDEEDNLPPPQFPALDSAQRVSGPCNGPPPSFTVPVKPSASLATMAPPPRPSPGSGVSSSTAMRPPTLAPLRGTPLPSNGLRIPPSGPLPNRGNSSSSLSVQLTTSVTQPNPRKKIALTPGHSPLDWAHLQKSHPNLAGVSGIRRVTPSMLKIHNGRKGQPAWASYQGRVYNISPYLPFHPGGEGELRRCAGKDGEKLFNEVHPWVNWDNMLEQCLVGILVSEHDTRAALSSPLEEMD